MQPPSKPFDTSFAEAFQDRQVVEAYRHRPPYPQGIFDILAGLITDEPRTILDVGAGTGDIARNCVEFVERVDAVDFSQHMIATGKHLPNGNHPRLSWIYGKVEDAPLSPPYALITAGSSIHWMERAKAFPRFRDILAPHGFVALIYRSLLPMPWDTDLQVLRKQFAHRQDHRSAHVHENLETHGFLHKVGEKKTEPVPFHQPLDDFIEGLHSRSSLSRAIMGQKNATEFDRQVRTLLLQIHKDGVLPLHIVGRVIWGTPDNGTQQSA